MFQLIIAVISIALVAALAIATIFYGGKAWHDHQFKTKVATLINHVQQIAAAKKLYEVDTGNREIQIRPFPYQGYMIEDPLSKTLYENNYLRKPKPPNFSSDVETFSYTPSFYEYEISDQMYYMSGQCTAPGYKQNQYGCYYDSARNIITRGPQEIFLKFMLDPTKANNGRGDGHEFCQKLKNAAGKMGIDVKVDEEPGLNLSGFMCSPEAMGGPYYTIRYAVP